MSLYYNSFRLPVCALNSTVLPTRIFHWLGTLLYSCDIYHATVISRVGSGVDDVCDSTASDLAMAAEIVVTGAPC